MSLIFDYYVEIRNRDNTVIDRLYKNDSVLLDFQWRYNRIGGCGPFTLKTKHGFNSPPPYSGNYDVRLYLIDVGTGNFILWYRGFIQTVKPDLKNLETTTITGDGYGAKLNRLTRDNTYTSDEISVIVKDILDTVVVPNTDITYEVGDIEATGFTADSLPFSNTVVSEAFQTLADIAGTYEWGVGSDLKFFFKERSATSTLFSKAGVNIVNFSWLTDYSKIVNEVIIEGGTVGGSKYSRTVSDAGSQDKWEVREKIFQNSAITTNTVADRYGNSILAEQSGPAQRGSMQLFRDVTNVAENTPIESTVPIGVMEFKRSQVRYGEKKYGTFLYGGSLKMQIQNIAYKLSDKGVDTLLTLGRPSPELALLMKQIEFDISQTRQRAT